MEIKKRIVFAANKAPELFAFLKANGSNCMDSGLNAVEIYESDPNWLQVKTLVEKYGLSCQSSTEFSEDERRNAEWMRVWSRYRSGYPQPESGYVKKAITYDPLKECSHCGSGSKQIGLFRMKKKPCWGKRHFAELNWIGDELFLSGTAKAVLENSNITGISFCEVLNTKGTESIADVYQLLVPFVLKSGLIEESSCIKQITVCPVCGQKKYVTSGIGMKIYSRGAFDGAPDVVKSYEIFGDMHYAVRSIFIRQSVYQLLVDNHLGKDLVFYPIKLVD